MNLARHAAVLWRFRGIAAIGLALGIVLAVLGSYQIAWNGGLSVTPRGTETWSSSSSLQVTQAGFPEGRVTLPPVPTDPKAARVDQSRDRLLYADPGRFSALAAQYLQFAVGDEVRRRLPGKPKPVQITATQVEGGPAFKLPVIDLMTTADTAAGAKALNVGLINALRDVLKTRQDQARIGPLQRIQLETLRAPTTAELTAGRSHTASILAFLLCLIGVVVVTHLLAALRGSDDDAEEPVAVLVPRAVGGSERTTLSEQPPLSKPERPAQSTRPPR